MKITVTTPTGHIGSHLTHLLREAGADLTLLVRNPDKLDADTRTGTHVVTGDQTDPEAVIRATLGADALFWLTPPNFAAPDVPAYYETLRQSVVQAIEANHIQRVVFISSGGGDSRQAGLVTQAFVTEDTLNATDADVVSLRCGYFMENFLAYVPTLKSDGAFYGVNRPDLPTPMVATQDIAQRAFEKIQDTSWSGKGWTAVHGPEDLTLTQAAAIVSEATGKAIRYQPIPPPALEQAMLGMGASPDVAKNYLEMMLAFDAGIYGAEPRTPETTTPTTLADWASRNLKPLLA